MDITTRISIEQKIVTRLISDLIDAEFTIRVFDGEAWAGKRSTNKAELFGQCFSTDMDTLYVSVNASGDAMGTVTLVYGNDGYDVIADNSLSLEPYLTGVEAYADTFQPS